MPREYDGYRDVNERLALWRQEILLRMARHDELATLPSYPRLPLARERGTTTRVDSYLGTHNTDRVDDVYFRVVDAAAGKCDLGSLPFPVENPDHAILAELRERFDLTIVAGDGDDLERAVRVRDWIKSLFPHYAPYRMPEWNALLILDRAARGVENFICMHYSVSLVQSCLSLGMQARMVNIHRGVAERYVVGEEAVTDPPVDEHVVAEVWSPRHDKWVMLDTDFDCHYEHDGTPLSAWDIHRAYVDHRLDDVRCQRGPHSQAFTARAERLANEDAFFARELPSYYAHVSVLMRNNFLSDPDGPVPVAHLVDDATAPILWHQGSDLRLQPHLMGPVVVATPLTDRTPLLTDGNTATGWSSADSEQEHWAEIVLPGDRLVGRIVLHWPEYAMYYRTSRRIRIDGLVGSEWVLLDDVRLDPEGPFTVHDIDPRVVRGVRVVQAPGDGFPAHPNRLWLTQVEIYGPRG